MPFDRVLNFRRVPPCAGRVINMTKEILDKSKDEELLKTFFTNKGEVVVNKGVVSYFYHLMISTNRNYLQNWMRFYCYKCKVFSAEFMRKYLQKKMLTAHPPPQNDVFAISQSSCKCYWYYSNARLP